MQLDRSTALHSRLSHDDGLQGDLNSILNQKAMLTEYASRNRLSNPTRFIAINDGVDSNNNAGNDFTPIRNLFNEFHARDTAKKVKDAMTVRGNSGKYLCTSPLYGFLRDPQDKDKCGRGCCKGHSAHLRPVH